MNRALIGRNIALPPRLARHVKTTKACRPRGVFPIALSRGSPSGFSLSGRITTGRANTPSISSIDIPCF
jgi:hypothetical protein